MASLPMLSYDLDLDMVNRRYSVSANAVDGFTGFCADDCPKIYLVCATRDASVIYVGRTINPMKTRFSQSVFSLDEKKQYAWSSDSGRGTLKPRAFRLIVWNLTGISDGEIALESVEAELVFCVRVVQKSWPRHQTSVNFHHIVNQGGRLEAPSVAICLLDQYYEDVLPRLVDPKMRELMTVEKGYAIPFLEALRFTS